MRTFTNEEIRDIYKEVFKDFENDKRLKRAVDKTDDIRFDLEQAIADVAHAAELKGFVEGFKLGVMMRAENE